MMTPSSPLEGAIALQVFTEALFDCHQRQHGLKPRWATVKEATRTHWRQSVAAAADGAWRSQYSPLARERIVNAPDPYRVFAMGLAAALGAARSRAKTARGISKAMRAAGGEAFSLWVSAIDAGVLAVQRSRGGLDAVGAPLLLLQLPALRMAA